MDNELQNMEEAWFLNAIMENVADSIYFKDRQCRILRASRKMAITNNLESIDVLIGKTDTDLYGEEFGQKTQIDDLHVMETGQPLIGLVESHSLENGEPNWTLTSKLPLRNAEGKIIGLLGITREINDLKRTELDLQHVATHDILTSLPNRYLFFNRLDHAILRAKRQKTQFAVMYIDLDNFKLINDHLGHDTGDRMLKEVSNLLKGIFRDSDTVARIGGDEFVILIESINKVIEPEMIAKRILDELSKDKKLSAIGEKISASIGISLYPQDGKDASSLTKAADHAMYQAKATRNTFRYFTAPQIPE
ncbi:MAG: GGDEF domain-containing protein [Anaerolineaceae bacterium]|nr:GGDEF domain-containing protein [Anaerolineaceae bacterium]